MWEHPEGRKRLRIFELPICHLKLEVTDCDLNLFLNMIEEKGAENLLKNQN